MEGRLNEIEKEQGKTVVYCSNIIDSQKRTEKMMEGFLQKQEDMNKGLQQMKIDAAVQGTQTKTRWDLLGKPVSMAAIGGFMTIGIQALISFIKKL